MKCTFKIFICLVFYCNYNHISRPAPFSTWASSPVPRPLSAPLLQGGHRLMLNLVGTPDWQSTTAQNSWPKHPPASDTGVAGTTVQATTPYNHILCIAQYVICI